MFDMPEPARKGTSISGVHSPRAITHDWITPKFIIDVLGEFDLDPCQSPTQPWLCAKRGIIQPRDGLSEPWAGRVWCNPPYSVHAAPWLLRMALHGSGIALVFARTETAMFFETAWSKASAILFLEGRLTFHYPNGRKADANAGGPSCLIAYSAADADCLASCGLRGALVRDVALVGGDRHGY